MLEAGWPLCPSLSGLLVLHGHQHPAFGANTLVFLPGKIPWAEEPGGLQSLGLQRVRHD